MFYDVFRRLCAQRGEAETSVCRKIEYESQIVEPPQKPVIIDGWIDYYRESPTKAKNTAWKTVIDRIIVNDQNQIDVVPF